MKQFNNRRGFTLIELLIVIAILGILSVAVVTALNIVGNLNKATLARAKTFNASVENALSINQVGKWSFEEQAGTIAKDTSGYGNNGTLLPSGSGPVWQDANQCGLGYGGCLKFDGDDDYVSIPNSDNWNFGNKEFTIGFWIRFNDVSGNKIIIEHASGTDYDWSIPKIGNTTIRFEFKNSLGGNFSLDDNTSLVINTWYYVTVTRTGNEFRIYRDGVLKNKATVGETIKNSNDILRIGKRDNGQEVNAFMDEVAIYKQALNSQNIQQLYAQGVIRHVLAFR